MTECGWGCGGVHAVDDAAAGLADARAADSAVALDLGGEGGDEDGEVVVAAWETWVC